MLTVERFTTVRKIIAQFFFITYSIDKCVLACVTEFVF